jgi:hypothetical protein
MSISKHSLLSVFLLTAVSVAFLMTSNCSVFAADCGAAISGCIAANAGKPDAREMLGSRATLRENGRFRKSIYRENLSGPKMRGV